MRSFLFAALAAMLLHGSAPAQLLKKYCPPVPVEPYCPPGATPGTAIPGPEGTPALPGPDNMGQVPDLNPNVFAQQNESGGAAARSFNDNFNGDFGGISCTCLATAGSIGNTSAGLGGTPGPNSQIIRLPAGSRFNGILNTDNDSPRPTTRAYFGYNYYQNVNGSYNVEKSIRHAPLQERTLPNQGPSLAEHDG
jgi:hypothetical protein